MSAVFSKDSMWWVPTVGPMIGGFVGALMYQLVLASQNPEPVVVEVDRDASGQGLAALELDAMLEAHTASGGGGPLSSTSLSASLSAEAEDSVTTVLRSNTSKVTAWTDKSRGGVVRLLSGAANEGGLRRIQTDIGSSNLLDRSESDSSNQQHARRRFRMELKGPEPEHSFLR